MAQRVVQISTSILAIKFTVLQAILSAVLSVAAAIPTSRALARQNFKGREVLISVLSAPFILPVIVAISGVLLIFGRGLFMAFVASYWCMCSLIYHLLFGYYCLVGVQYQSNITALHAV